MIIQLLWWWQRLYTCWTRLEMDAASLASATCRPFTTACSLYHYCHLRCCSNGYEVMSQDGLKDWKPPLRLMPPNAPSPDSAARQTVKITAVITDEMSEEDYSTRIVA